MQEIDIIVGDTLHLFQVSATPHYGSLPALMASNLQPVGLAQQPPTLLNNTCAHAHARAHARAHTHTHTHHTIPVFSSTSPRLVQAVA